MNHSTHASISQKAVALLLVLLLALNMLVPTGSNVVRAEETDAQATEPVVTEEKTAEPIAVEQKTEVKAKVEASATEQADTKTVAQPVVPAEKAAVPEKEATLGATAEQANASDAAPAADKNIYYIGPNGNDNNNGTTFNSPFLTLKKAIETLDGAEGSVYVLPTDGGKTTEMSYDDREVKIKSTVTITSCNASGELENAPKNTITRSTTIKNSESVTIKLSENANLTIDNVILNGGGDTVEFYSGVFFVDDATAKLTMQNEAVIEDGHASRSGAGGVFVQAGNFVMNGGTIQNCTDKDANYSGGGLCVSYKGNATINAGTITNCSGGVGGGVYSESNKSNKLTLGTGTINITGNHTIGAPDKANNVWLNSATVITINETALSESSKVGISKKVNSDAVDVVKSTQETVSNTGFFSDAADLYLITDSQSPNTLQLSKEKPVITYTVDGTITGSDTKVGIAAKVELKDKDSNVLNTATTQADGKYSFTDVQKGEGYTITASADGYKTAVSDSFNVTDSNIVDKNLELVKRGPDVCKNTTTKVAYDSLVTAFSEAKDNEVIQMVADYTFNEKVELVSSQTYELDLNGHTVAGSGKESYIYTDFKANFTLSDSGKNGQLKKGTESQSLIRNYGNGTVTINGGRLSGDSPGILIRLSNDGKLQFNKGIADSGDKALALEIQNEAEATINGGVLTSKRAESDGFGTVVVFDKHKAALTVTGGTISNTCVPEGYSVYIDSKDLSIFENKGGTVGRVYPEAETYSISGTITGSDTKAGIAAHVVLKDKENKEVKSVDAQQNGTYSLEKVTPGEGYTITASAEGYKSSTSESFKVDKNIADINLTLEKNIIPVTSVKLNKNEIALKVGTGEILTATVAPENATNKAVSWTSDKVEVASVDENGKVTAKAAGTATITVTTVDGSKTDTCIVTVTGSAHPVVVVGNSEWTPDSKEGITLKAEGDLAKFVEVRINGKTLDKTNYTATSGSTIITFKPEYLKTLAVGKYTVDIVFTDGQGQGEFIIKAVPTPTPVPNPTPAPTPNPTQNETKATSVKTGVTNNPFAMMLPFALAGLAVVLLVVRKRKSN